MTDLTSVFLETCSLETQYQKLYEILKSFAKENSFSIDWDFEDGELWGKIFDSNKKAGMFHATLPLMFADILYFERFDNFLKQQDFKYSIVEIDDWDDKNYSINLPLLKNILDWHSDLPSNLFSINDLWFATI